MGVVSLEYWVDEITWVWDSQHQHVSIAYHIPSKQFSGLYHQTKFERNLFANARIQAKAKVFYLFIYLFFLMKWHKWGCFPWILSGRNNMSMRFTTPTHLNSIPHSIQIDGKLYISCRCLYFLTVLLPWIKVKVNQTSIKMYHTTLSIIIPSTRLIWKKNVDIRSLLSRSPVTLNQGQGQSDQYQNVSYNNIYHHTKYTTHMDKKNVDKMREIMKLTITQEQHGRKAK